MSSKLDAMFNGLDIQKMSKEEFMLLMETAYDSTYTDPKANKNLIVAMSMDTKGSRTQMVASASGGATAMAADSLLTSLPTELQQMVVKQVVGKHLASLTGMNIGEMEAIAKSSGGFEEFAATMQQKKEEHGNSDEESGGLTFNVRNKTKH